MKPLWTWVVMQSSACGAALLVSLTAPRSGATRSVVVERPSTPAPQDSAAVAVPSPTPAARPSAPAGCPDGMAAVERFCIDRYEAHLVTRVAGGGVAQHAYYERPEPGVVYEARSAPGVFPQAYVSRVESQAACTNAGKRLCSRTEWQRACQGTLGTRYPYADRWQPKRCNMDKPHLLTLLFGADVRLWRYQTFNDPVLDQEPGFLARAGEHPGCAGDAGVYDLVGNVHEWVSDTVDATLIGQLTSEGILRTYQPVRVGNGVFMGGFFSTHEEHGPGCRFTTVAHEPGYHDYSTGFRCCANAPG